MLRVGAVAIGAVTVDVTGLRRPATRAARRALGRRDRIASRSSSPFRTVTVGPVCPGERRGSGRPHRCRDRCGSRAGSHCEPTAGGDFHPAPKTMDWFDCGDRGTRRRFWSIRGGRVRLILVLPSRLIGCQGAIPTVDRGPGSGGGRPCAPIVRVGPRSGAGSAPRLAPRRNGLRIPRPTLDRAPGACPTRTAPPG